MNVLQMAISQIGIKESPANSNRVKYNTWYYGKTVSGSAYPWCAVFIAWCFAKAGKASSIAGVKNKAYCPSYVSWAMNNKNWKGSPSVGALALFDWNHDGIADHIGIVEKIPNGSQIVTIEGNTSTSNQSNGGQVMRRTRQRSSVMGYVVVDIGATKKATTTKTSTKKGYTGTFPAVPAKGYIGKGDKGENVKRLQRFLNWYGSYGLAVDGVFGPKTLAAVKKFQKAVGTGVDGQFGPKSLAKAKAVKK